MLQSILDIRKRDSRIFSRERKHSVASFHIAHFPLSCIEKNKNHGKDWFIKHFDFYKLDF
ncbi:hypothetical protein LEP1GSC133_3291 [Leptospira borgpetersenii serovar Pomona str. 200901868]|uniref:Uncharacterized protein n=2 Tax=Leptospira borgpetersenii TaxID=174 RepID=M6VXH5_LEPBO|nr:hypothetical protein LEP1GSC133_3291 [Leptospira borgpetersenii serovar Pomona str. 200901868]